MQVNLNPTTHNKNINKNASYSQEQNILAEKISQIIEPSCISPEEVNKIDSKQDKFQFDKSKIITPGVEIAISENDSVIFHKAYGVKSIEDNKSDMNKLEKHLIFDLGSATQVLVTIPIVMKLIEQRLLDPQVKVSRVLQTFGSAGKENMKIIHLLEHTSGYTSKLPLHRTLIKGVPTLNSLLTRRSALNLLYKEIYRTRLEHLPGKVINRSDLGYILLGNIVEVITGTTLQKLYTQLVSRPLELHSTGFIDLELVRRKKLCIEQEMIIASGKCSWRKKRLHGEVYDELAWALGGISAHNGLFGSAIDVLKYLNIYLSSIRGDSSFFDSSISRIFSGVYEIKNADEVDQPKLNPFGWEHFKLDGSRTIIGFWSSTGVGMWLNPVTNKSIVFASNCLQIGNETERCKNLALKIVKEVL